MKHRMKWLVAAVAALALLTAVAGCTTETRVDRVGPTSFVVCDDAQVTCDGANPEKGLPQTCFKIGRTIESYHEIQNQALAVTCGPRLAHKG